ncbi:class I SAM-dependent methyltransferase [Acerihabitans arboris]|uniref:Methyltransferase domain-containing protein n=1 Tax=Acerihabitans arboris TaxID=2691583 RepID=A0A845SKB7_9GAMM|nr:class I SAM-dependent methyltransferase [Acerihabitans arboris]NDL63404.1 methyltransferase domain-containing protein [Acerihabitans arboris]
MSGTEAGHKFLARMGKTRLRPGGKRATEWLIKHGGFNQTCRVLEVACNMGTTAIEIAGRFRCHVTGVDMDNQALEQARRNVAAKQMQQWVTITQADALCLPFPDNHFDIVINEAMLTMYADKAKVRLVQEYLRVLKPGGRLLTHDIMINDPLSATNAVMQMRRAINVNAQPMTQQGWLALFREAGAERVDFQQGRMTLLSPRGLIYDEGLTGTLRIIRNALQKANRPMFLTMYRTFRRNRRLLRYIALCGTKRG